MLSKELTVRSMVFGMGLQTVRVDNLANMMLKLALDGNEYLITAKVDTVHYAHAAEVVV